MQIYIGHIDKRLNSTKRTITGTWTTKGAIDVKLKEPTDIKTPTFLLQREVWVGDPPVLYYRLLPTDNYIYCPSWGYYWIDDIVYETNGLISMICHRDVLATGKDYLMKPLYLSYCSDITKTLTNRVLDDERFGPDFFAGFNEANLEYQSQSLVYKYLVNEPIKGSVLLKALIQDGGMATYILSFSDYIDFIKKFTYEVSNFNTLDDFTLAFFGNNWRDAVVSATYVPLDYNKLNSFYSSTTPDVMVGGIVTSMGHDIHYTYSPYNVACGEYIIDIPFIDICDNHYYKFLRGTKYTSIQLEYPGGTIDLSNDCFCVYNKILVEESFNIFSGEMVMKFFATDNTKAKGPQVGITQLNLQMDVTGMMNQMQTSGETMAGIAAKAFKMLPALGAGLMTAGAASVAAKKAASAATAHNEQVKAGMLSAAANGQEYRGPASVPVPQPDQAITMGTQMSIATGIAGAFLGGHCSTAGRVGSISSSLTGYFHAQNNDGQTVWVADTFRLTTSTVIPEAFRQDLDVDPAATNFYPTFCSEYGYPCNRLVDVSTVAKGSYVKAVGATLGNITNTRFTLYPTEISELNNLIASGIYIED